MRCATVLLLVLVVVAGTVPVMPPPVDANGNLTTLLLSSGDTYVKSATSNENEGANPRLTVRAAGNNRALVRFDQQAIQDAIGGGTLLEAILEVDVVYNGDNWGPTGRPINVHRLTRDWVEGNGDNRPGGTRGTGAGATWACAIDSEISNHLPDCSEETDTIWEMDKPKEIDLHPWLEEPTASVTMIKGFLGTMIFNVTQDVQAFLDGSPNYGWMIRKANEDQAGEVQLASRETGPTGPRLILTYTAAPPTALTLLGVKDSFIKSAESNQNEGAGPRLRIQSAGSNRVLVGFTPGQISTQNLTKAWLILTIAENGNNWGNPATRTVSAHALKVDFAEGNGLHEELGGLIASDGSGSGVTWNCATDTNIANSTPDCVLEWKGADGISSDPNRPYYDPATAPAILHGNASGGGAIPGMTPGSEVRWDVTLDVQAGRTAWLVRKTDEGSAGKMLYYSKEGAATQGNAGLAPRLLLEYGN
jgi:hypothetical protein